MRTAMTFPYESRFSQSTDICSVKTAGFPQYKYIEDLKRDELPEGIRSLLSELETLEFVRQGHNIVLYDNPGTGKTHVAIALGILACKERMSVMFTSVPHLSHKSRNAAHSAHYMLWRHASSGMTLSSAMSLDTWPATRRAVSCSSIISRSEPIQRPPSSPQTCPSTAGERSSRTRSWPMPWSTGLHTTHTSSI